MGAGRIESPAPTFRNGDRDVTLSVVATHPLWPGVGQSAPPVQFNLPRSLYYTSFSLYQNDLAVLGAAASVRVLIFQSFLTHFVLTHLLFSFFQIQSG